MQVKVHRDIPTPPPISDVVIYLTPEEAYRLRNFCGRVSRAKIRELFQLPKLAAGSADDPVEELFQLTSGLYNQINEGIKGDTL